MDFSQKPLSQLKSAFCHKDGKPMEYEWKRTSVSYDLYHSQSLHGISEDVLFSNEVLLNENVFEDDKCEIASKVVMKISTRLKKNPNNHSVYSLQRPQEQQRMVHASNSQPLSTCSEIASQTSVHSLLSKKSVQESDEVSSVNGFYRYFKSQRELKQQTVPKSSSADLKVDGLHPKPTLLTINGSVVVLIGHGSRSFAKTSGKVRNRSKDQKANYDMKLVASEEPFCFPQPIQPISHEGTGLTKFDTTSSNCLDLSTSEVQIQQPLSQENLDPRNFMLCPITDCGGNTTVSNFVPHLCMLHPTLQREILLPGMQKLFQVTLAPGQSYQAVLLVCPKSQDLVSGPFLPIILNANSARLQVPADTENNNFYTLIWLSGVVPDAPATTITLIIQSPVPELYYQRKSLTDTVCGVRCFQNYHSIYKSGKALILTPPEMQSLTLNGTQPLLVNVVVH